MADMIRIGSAQGFWGDRIDAPDAMVAAGPLDFLMMDYLAEVTMSIMQKQKQRDPNMGYARDFPKLMERLLPQLVEKNVRVISNAGGVNPKACMEKVLEAARKHNLKGLKVAIVHGDNILDDLKGLIEQGHAMENMDTGAPLKTVLDSVVSANIYFGAEPIAQALDAGAHIVITGRCTDTGLTLAPMIHTYGWAMNDWDKIAAGTVAGHLLECGAQASGGNFCADWRSVPDFANIGYPIAEANADGSFIITKHPSLGGLINQSVIKEQLLYELGDPKQYITPDVVIDFTSISLTDDGKDRVGIQGITGKPFTPTYKVSIAYEDGFKSTGQLTYTWPDALDKARAADRMLRKRLDMLNLKFDEVRTEFVGLNSCHGALSHIPENDQLNEVVMKVSVRGASKADVSRFGFEIAPLILTGPPSVTGFAGGRPKASDVVAYWPALLDKKVAEPIVEVEEV